MDPENVHYLNMFLGTGAILLQIISVATLLILFFGSKQNKYLDFVKRNFLSIGFLLALSASFFSLIYSEIVNFLPCYLCWYQRIFMFPLVFIFGVAAYSRDRNIIRYALPITCVGLAISLYQNFFYYFGDGAAIPCDASGVSCYQHLISEFGGYISIPMLSMTSFAAILVLVAVAHFYQKETV